MKSKLLKFNLQMFADGLEGQEGSAGSDDAHDSEGEQEEKKEVKEEKEETYTKTQMEEIINKRVMREKKATEKAVEEAQKLAAMNEVDKKQYEFEQLQNELNELKKKDAYYGLSKEATKMLSEQSIQADDDLLAFVVKDDAEATKTAVNSFVSLINTKVEEGVKKALAGNSPRTYKKNSNAITKEIFGNMGYKDKVELNQNNPELYKQLTKGD